MERNDQWRGLASLVSIVKSVLEEFVPTVQEVIEMATAGSDRIPLTPRWGEAVRSSAD